MRYTLLIVATLWGSTCVFAQHTSSGKGTRRLIKRETNKLMVRGETYFARKKWELAIDCGYLVIKLDSSRVDGYCLVAKTYTAQFDYVRALNILRLSEKYAPGDPEVTLRMAQLWVVLNNAMEALHYYQQSQSLQPSEPWGYLGSSVVLYGLNRKEESLQVLEQGLSLSHFHLPYFVWFKGVLLYEKNDLRNALLTFKKLYDYQFREPAVNFYIGMCYFKEGSHPNLARRYLRKAEKKGMTIDEQVRRELAI